MKPDSVSGTKLSSDLFADYQNYKKNTKVFLCWLIDNDGASRIKPNTLASVKQLIHLARVSKDSDHAVPIHVLQALKSSIKNRKKITNFFKSTQDKNHAHEDEITRSHEHFTSTLSDVLRILQENGPMQSFSENSIKADSPGSQMVKPANIFEVLGSEAVDAEDKLESFAITEKADSGLRVPLSYLSQVTNDCGSIEDDSLAEIVEIFMVVLELDTICSAVKLLWEHAGAGLIPVILASWSSSAALRGVERWLTATTNILQVSEHRNLINNYVDRLRVLDVNLRPTADIAPKYTPFTAGYGLSTAWLALENFKFSRQHDEKLMSGCLFENPTDHITVQQDLSDGLQQMKVERTVMDLILKSMKQLLWNENDLPKSFTLDINPLLVNVEEYLHSDGESVTTSLVFGMQLLVESFKSFLLCDGAIQGTNCRTLALKFALEVNHSLKTITAKEDSIGCECPNCGGADLSEFLLCFEIVVNDYLSQKRYDLYYQTPWVAGQHMQEILSLATDYGLRLCDRQSYLAIVLHLYNLLWRLGILQDKIPLLESLCGNLQNSVFLGIRPSRNYHSHFIRFLGGRLDFSDTSGHHDQAWCMKIPKAASIRSERKRRLVPSQISRFYDIENIHYAIDIDRWTSIYQAKKEAKATRQERARVQKSIDSNSFAVSLLQLKDYAAPEFSGDFPIARINYFAIHLGCMRVLERIASIEEDHLLTEQKLPPASLGMLFAIDLLRQVDEFQKYRLQGLLLSYTRSLRSSLRRCKEAFIEVLQGALALEDFSAVTLLTDE